jgi:putative transposase
LRFIKGKSAIQIARNFQGRKKNFVGQNFWARGYYVSTVGKDEAAVRAYIQAQELEDQRLEQLKLFNRFERFRISSHRLCRW